MMKNLLTPHNKTFDLLLALEYDASERWHCNKFTYKFILRTDDSFACKNSDENEKEVEKEEKKLEILFPTLFPSSSFM